MNSKNRDAARCCNTGGVGMEVQGSPAIHLGAYQNARNLQARWLRRRHGLPEGRAALVASLFFGEAPR